VASQCADDLLELIADVQPARQLQVAAQHR
jgi:hypothetical protein